MERTRTAVILAAADIKTACRTLAFEYLPKKKERM
jgi:hypothetical protein